MAEMVGYGLWTSLNLPQPLEAAGPRQVGGLLTQLLALLDQRLEGEAAATEAPLTPTRSAGANCAGPMPFIAQSERNSILTYNKVYAQ